MSNLYIGIDNGVSGGVAAIGSLGHYIEGARMPVITRQYTWRAKPTKGGSVIASQNEIDAPRLIAWLKNIIGNQDATIAIEECPKHADRAATMRSMGISYGILIGAITVALPGAELVIVRSGNPLDSWQRAMLGKVATGGTKAAARGTARYLWPCETFTPKGCRTPNNGIIDAALIAEFIRRKYEK